MAGPEGPHHSTTPDLKVGPTYETPDRRKRPT